jgi:hypothetical protein
MERPFIEWDQQSGYPNELANCSPEHSGAHARLLELAIEMEPDFEPYGQGSREGEHWQDCSCGCRHFAVLEGPLGAEAALEAAAPGGLSVSIIERFLRTADETWDGAGSGQFTAAQYQNNEAYRRAAKNAMRTLFHILANLLPAEAQLAPRVNPTAIRGRIEPVVRGLCRKTGRRSPSGNSSHGLSCRTFAGQRRPWR